MLLIHNKVVVGLKTYLESVPGDSRWDPKVYRETPGGIRECAGRLPVGSAFKRRLSDPKRISCMVKEKPDMQTPSHRDTAGAAMALQIFSASFGSDGEHQANLTAIVVDGEPFFRGGEVAAALGYKNTRMAVIDHVDEEDKTTLQNLRSRDSLPLKLSRVVLSSSST